MVWKKGRMSLENSNRALSSHKLNHFLSPTLFYSESSYVPLAGMQGRLGRGNTIKISGKSSYDSAKPLVRGGGKRDEFLGKLCCKPSK